MKLTRTVQNVQAKNKPAKQVAVENENGMQISYVQPAVTPSDLILVEQQCRRRFPMRTGNRESI